VLFFPVVRIKLVLSFIIIFDSKRLSKKFRNIIFF